MLYKNTERICHGDLRIRAGTRPSKTLEPFESANSAYETVEKVTINPLHCTVDSPSSYFRNET